MATEPIPQPIISTPGSEVMSTSQFGLKKWLQLLTGNTITGVRESTDIYKQRIVKCQERLIDLRACESNLKNRLYASVDSEEIRRRYGCEGKQTVEPQQGLIKIPFVGNPDHSMMFNKNKLREEVPGFKEIEDEINKIETEIKDINARIRTYTSLINAAEAMIKTNDKAAFQIKIEKDRITKTLLSYLLFLKNLSETFKSMNTGVENTVVIGIVAPKYTTGDIYEKKRNMMRETFKAYIRSIGKIDPAYITGNKQMDLANIGNQKNIDILNANIASLKNIAEKNTSVKEVAQLQNTINKFTNNLLGTATDVNRGKDINSADYYKVEPGNMLAPTTKDTATMMNQVASGTFWTKWEKISEAESVLRNFVGLANNTLQSLPPCPGSKVVDESTILKNETIQAQQNAGAKAAKEMQDLRAKEEAEIKAKADLLAKNKSIMEQANIKYQKVLTDAESFGIEGSDPTVKGVLWSLTKSTITSLKTLDISSLDLLDKSVISNMIIRLEAIELSMRP